MAARKKGMRISELVRRTGTSRETIHFYLREGLLSRPEKTSRNMAYYDEGHVEQLNLIRRLRTESYLPLSAIKKVLAEGNLGARARHLDLSGDLFGRGAQTDLDPLTRAELAARTQTTEAQIEGYEARGLLRPTQTAEGPRYGHAELRAVELIAETEREAQGANASLVLERFALIEQHMQALVDAEVGHFFARVVSSGDPARVFEVLEGGRGTIGRYMALARARALRRQVDAMLPDIEGDPAAPKEPFYFPAPPAAMAAAGDVEEQARLRADIEAHPGRAVAYEAAVQHALLTGQPERVLDLLAAAPARAKSRTDMRLALGDALMQTEQWDDALACLEALRAETTPKDPRVEALWGAIVLVRIRERFRDLESSHELVGHLSRAFAAFETARTLPAEAGLDYVRVHLLLGRIGVAAPAFLGTRPQALDDLERARAALETLQDAPDDPALRPLGFGGRVWLEHNLSTLAQTAA